jgi:hypothetical protein
LSAKTEEHHPTDFELNVKEKILSAYLSKRQERGITPHISDLSNCLRRTAFLKLDTFVLDDKTIRNFLVGELFHNQLGGLLGQEFICEQKIAWTGPKTGIKVIAHPDAIWLKDGAKIPIEISEVVKNWAPPPISAWISWSSPTRISPITDDVNLRLPVTRYPGNLGME